MAINTYPAVASPVKSIQRGSAAGAGTVTISAIDISKSMVNIFGTTSSGTVAASFGLSAASAGSTSASSFTAYNNAQGGATLSGYNTSSTQQVTVNAMNVNAFNYNVNAGTNNLVAAVVQGYLSNSTSLVVSGACRYEIVEFN